MKQRFTPQMLSGAASYITPQLLRGYSLWGMFVLVVLSFISVNAHALLWQTSDWLVGTVLPAVVVDLTNQERQSLAAAPLQRNSALDEAARLKAEHMVQEGYFAHYSPTGVTPWHWFAEAGYSFVHAGENLAIHFSDSHEVISAWMNSPTHRDNIVDPKYLEIGVGTARGEYQGHETVFVVQLFGAPAASVSDTPSSPIESVVVAAPTSTSVMAERRPAAEQVAGVSKPVAASPVPIATTSTSTIVAPAVSAESVTKPEVVTSASLVAADSTATASTAPETIVEAVEMSDELVSVYSNTLTSSTPLLPARIDRAVGGAVSTRAPILGRLATQPNTVLQIVYIMLGGLIGVALFMSVLLEWRRHHPLQVAYGVLLLCVMSGLFYLHMFLTSGALIA